MVTYPWPELSSRQLVLVPLKTRHIEGLIQKEARCWVFHQLTPNGFVMDRISICEALAKRNEIDPFLKWMVTGEEKWVPYNNIVRKRSWSKRGETAQTVAKPGLTARKVLLCI
ncbi:hypothetical protein TNCV_4835151 [Trichonephila clavipes]|nr:hypothetical protein TNCV_4835151 [Trichonephila clavipes]